MATSLVEELIQLAQDEGTPLPELLRRTRVLAAKLKLPELEDWVKKETSGYRGLASELPEYRRIRSQLKALNPFRGWVPVLFEDAGKISDYFTTVHLANPAAEIQELLGSGDGVLSQPLEDWERSELEQWNPGLGRTQLARRFGKASLRGVLDSIRGRVLDAALELDSKGIKGEGLSFSAEERAKAAAATTNIFNNIYGDNANVASAAHSPNSAIAAGSENVTAGQRIAVNHQGNQELADAFKNVLEALRTDRALDASKRAEAQQHLAFLAEQAAMPTQKRQTRAVIKSVGAGFSQVAALSANLSKVWDTFGPAVMATFGS